MSSYKLSKIPCGELVKFVNISHLTMTFGITFPAEVLWALPHLTSLDLSSNNRFTHPGLQHLTGLTSLSLANRGVRCMDSITALVNLTHLDLSYNSSIIWRNGTAGNTNLTSLLLRGNCFIRNDGLEFLVNLTLLDLSDNHFITDSGIAHLTKLKTLHVKKSVIERSAIIPLPPPVVKKPVIVIEID